MNEPIYGRLAEPEQPQLDDPIVQNGKHYRITALHHDVAAHCWRYQAVFDEQSTPVPEPVDPLGEPFSDTLLRGRELNLTQFSLTQGYGGRGRISDQIKREYARLQAQRLRLGYVVRRDPPRLRE